MSSVGVFFHEHYKVILIGLSITLIGIFVNWLVGKQTNKSLLAKLTSELESLQGKSSLTPDEQNLVNYLKGEIYILKFKC